MHIHSRFNCSLWGDLSITEAHNANLHGLLSIILLLVSGSQVPGKLLNALESTLFHRPTGIDGKNKILLCYANFISKTLLRVTELCVKAVIAGSLWALTIATNDTCHQLLSDSGPTTTRLGAASPSCPF